MLVFERHASLLTLLLYVCAIVTGAACASGDGYKDVLLGNGYSPVGANDEAGVPQLDAGIEDGGTASASKCEPASTSEPLPAREEVSAEAGAVGLAESIVFTTDLFSRFVDHCGSCHAGLAAQGALNVNASSFATRIDERALMRIRSDDVAFHMPPPPLGKPFSERGANDPIVGFAKLLEQWLAAGRPMDFFSPEKEGEEQTSSPYLLTRDVATNMTNLGDCIPEAATVSTEHEKIDELDAKFAAMKSLEDLPKSLRDTDLFTLDTATLARHSVVAFAPAYTLWADQAKKIRFVRVPRGKSIRFDRDAQSFDIPANTRFYKTFLKRVVDFEGNVRYRKIESRLIVSRPDDGDAHTALFASYKWNEEETEATLQEVAYRDGTGFADDVFTYIQDEKAEDAVLREAPADIASALREAGATRSYAIPGSDRCIHCHMGAPQKDFILGFSPLQLRRRPMGEGGVLEPVGRDELNQVQRLIDYGVITGMRSVADIAGLEDTQGDRKPRNDHELNAQGYIVGNCAHCHNPRGFPSRREPVLADVLNFMPDHRAGGVFQFPLDKVSPRIFRGESQKVPTPYISPSLYDMPALGLFPNSAGESYSDKWIPPKLGEEDQAELRAGGYQFGITKSGVIDVKGNPARYPYPSGGRPLHAPWRSLIYRNVDAPFSYQDGLTVFPHMPMDTPGYDCRARQLLGSWMTSIPARWKNSPAVIRKHSALYDAIELIDADPLPYEEVTPNQPDYDAAVADAERRLGLFRSSPRYTDCPAPELDILSPDILRGERTAPLPKTVELYAEDGETVIGGYFLPSVPGRPHYFKTDLHEDPIWGIRRSDWFDVLVGDGVDITKPDSDRPAQIESADALAVLREVTLDEEFRTFALTAVPFGLWDNKPECASKLQESARTVGSIPSADRPAWMAYRKAPEDAYVFAIAPGAQVFSAICSKCHGSLADGQSALAATIADLSGGLARVANLRNGLFGPIDEPGANRLDRTKFGRADSMMGLSVDQWAARYVAWMGMSGTNATIPTAAVAQIGAAVVLGTPRESNIMAIEDERAAANMLSAVKAACTLLLPIGRIDFNDLTGSLQGEAGLSSNEARQRTLEGRGLIFKNGDAELWQQLCNYHNPAPVRVVTNTNGTAGKAGLGIFNEYFGETDHHSRLFRRDAYPAGAEVGFGANVVTEITEGNIFPWCFKPFDDAELEQLEAEAGHDLPRCPEALFEQGDNGRPRHALSRQDANRWALRGAAYAGHAVFAYLDAVSKGQTPRVPSYDRCEQLDASE